jgi:hypothetical protein
MGGKRNCVLIRINVSQLHEHLVNESPSAMLVDEVLKLDDSALAIKSRKKLLFSLRAQQ